MTDYSRLIDPETWAFIERTNAFYPPDTVDFSIAEQRAVYDRMCRDFFAGYPAGVTAETGAVRAGGRAIPTRTYRKQTGGASAFPDDEHAGSRPAHETGAATVLYFHGGGFVLGGLDSHDDVCAELCGLTGYEVVSVDYRLTPEHVHPAQFDDALAAFEQVAARRTAPLLLCGDSAGGNLAAAVAHATRRHPRTAVGQVLIYPGLGGDDTKGSYVTHAEAPMLTTRDIAFYRDLRAGGADVSADPTFSPLADTDFSGLTPTVIVTAECDPLSSDGEAYRERIMAAGGKALWIEEPGLVHGFLRARHSVKRAARSFERIAAALAALSRGQWPDAEA